MFQKAKNHQKNTLAPERQKAESISDGLGFVSFYWEKGFLQPTWKQF